MKAFLGVAITDSDRPKTILIGPDVGFSLRGWSIREFIWFSKPTLENYRITLAHMHPSLTKNHFVAEPVDIDALFSASNSAFY